jgi:hypothetical protein
MQNYTLKVELCTVSFAALCITISHNGNYIRKKLTQ